MLDQPCREFRFLITDLAIMAGQRPNFESQSTLDSGKVLRLDANGVLDRSSPFERFDVGRANLSIYFGDRVEAWVKGAILKLDGSYRVVINADEAFGPAFPALFAAISHRPTEWHFLLSVPEDVDLIAPDFENVKLVGAAARWASAGFI